MFQLLPVTLTSSVRRQRRMCKRYAATDLTARHEYRATDKFGRYFDHRDAPETNALVRMTAVDH